MLISFIYFFVTLFDFAVICNLKYLRPFLSKIDFENFIKMWFLIASPGGIISGSVGAMISISLFSISSVRMISTLHFL